ncbi:MAG: DUF721 domain-containing protein [Phormidesmis sp.]
MALEGLNGLIKGLENQESWQAQQQFRLVLQHWPKAVGFAVARKTRPISIQRGTLYVATATAAWAQTLLYERFNILRKLNRYQKSPLQGIRFSSAQWTQWAQSQTSANPDSQAQTQLEQSKLAHHPSYIGHVPSLPTLPVKTPVEAFQRWADTMQHMQSAQALCPCCRCRCPQGELDRWATCAICAAKQW